MRLGKSSEFVCQGGAESCAAEECGEICCAKFKRNAEAKRHRETVHEKLRENKSSACSGTFSQKGHLNEHIRVTHSESNVHSCHVCVEKFGVKAKMTRYVATVYENLRSFK
mmetsp:Transcript_42699/g.166854  ORF Transcript_42699/g.166854 Transcript_42699/m.166854 type:complete len:111 (+) Transcript_42699:468-800(+)